MTSPHFRLTSLAVLAGTVILLPEPAGRCAVNDVRMLARCPTATVRVEMTDLPSTLGVRGGTGRDG